MPAATTDLPPGLPDGPRLARTTPEFTAETVPEGLLEAGAAQLIEPGLLHHVERADDARLVVEFYR